MIYFLWPQQQLHIQTSDFPKLNDGNSKKLYSFLKGLLNHKIKQNGRLPAAYFPPTNFAKDAFWKDESFFSRNYCSSNFAIFPNLKIFWFFADNLTIKVEKTFTRNDIIWYTFYSKFATLTNFEKKTIFLNQKNIDFFKKLIQYALRNLKLFNIFQTHSTANLLQFGDEKFSRSEPSNIGHFHIVHYQLASKHKKRSLWVNDFSPILYIWQKITKKWIVSILA